MSNTTKIIRSFPEPEVCLYNNDVYDIYCPYSHPFLDEVEIEVIIQKLNKTLEFYKKHKDQIDIKNEQWLIDEYIKNNELRQAEKKHKEKKQQTNIYVMKDNHTGHYKIGRSKNPVKREATLLSQKSSIELLFFFEGTINQEKMLHEIFQDKWVRGEWFELTEEDLQSIKKIGGLL